MIRVNFLRAILFVLILGTAVSCKKDKDPDPSSNGNPNNGGGDNNGSKGNEGVTFLKVGTKHTYLYTGFFSGTLLASVEQEVGKDTFMVRHASEDVTSVYPTVYYVLKDGNLSSSFRLRDPDSYVVRCKFNVPAGTSWAGTENGSSYYCTIDSVGVSVNTGKGVVKDAVKVKIIRDNGTVYNYYSPTVGMIGSGSFGSDAEVQLEDYTISTVQPSGKPYPITFGNFSFMKAGNKWRYSESSFAGEDYVNINIESKVPNSNIYYVKVYYESAPNNVSYQYWYEDNGLLMVYEAGESILKADPIYMDESLAKIGYGWTGKTGTNTIYLYKIKELNSAQSTLWGDLPCEGIAVSNGLFTSQINYWNKDKGNVYVSGLLEREVVSSNAKEGKSKVLIPGVNF